ncbi:MAG: hypothetical protein Q4B29_00680 [Candidatus Saccharibacteria bacterium]|nr:hypothetical protein [Candidatus Saccharibacteria bacterium]
MDNKNLPNALSRLPEEIGCSARMRQYGQVALDALKNLSNADTESLFMAINEERAKTVTAREILEGNRFNVPSSVDVRALHDVEGMFYDKMPDVDFIDIAPLQPMGLSMFLTGTSEKKIVSSTRNSEANADPTNSLFRIAYNEFKDTPVRIATHCRSTRAQNFGENSKLLPHFKTFCQVSVGRQGLRHGEEEIRSLLAHLNSELSVLRSLIPEENLSVSVSNVLFSKELVRIGMLDKETLRKDMRNYSQEKYDVRAIKMRDSGEVLRVLEEQGVQSGVKIFKLFDEVLKEDFPHLVDKLEIDLNRVAGMDYYKHMCYKVVGFTEEGEPIPLDDGGTTDWAQKVGGRKDIYTVTSGVGTELLTKNFVRKDENGN